MFLERKLELKVFGLYSKVADDLKCRVQDVDKVYSWYLDQVYKSLKETSTIQIYLKGMGMFRANPACVSNVLYTRIHKPIQIANIMVNIPKHHTLKKFQTMEKEHTKFKLAYEQAKEKMDILLDLDAYNKPMYLKQRIRLYKFEETQLNKLYESVQRIYESYQAGSEECRQDSGGAQLQGLEKIQFTK
jgi:hypothetical protein